MKAVIQHYRHNKNRQGPYPFSLFRENLPIIFTMNKAFIWLLFTAFFLKTNLGNAVSPVHIISVLQTSAWPLLPGLFLVPFAVFGIIQYRTGLLKKRDFTLESRVRERTKTLEESLEELRKAKNQLEEKVALQARILSCVSHDIRTPLQHIQLIAGSIPDLITSNNLEEAERRAALIRYTSERSYHLAEDILNFLKPQVNAPGCGDREVNLYKLVTDKASFFRTMLGSGGGELIVKVDPRLRVKTDPRLLSIVIHNLFDNAVKIKQGNSITVTSRQKGDSAVLIIADAGPGLPPALTEWINDQPDSAVLPPHYEGFGLAMVLHIVRSLNLSISVENNPGAHFRLVFPGR